jgi:hypothetical protein
VLVEKFGLGSGAYVGLVVHALLNGVSPFEQQQAHEFQFSADEIESLEGLLRTLETERFVETGYVGDSLVTVEDVFVVLALVQPALLSPDEQFVASSD